MNATGCPGVSAETLGSRCETSDERLSLQRPLRERSPKEMGEAPVKYELTGASCHLRTEARGVA